MQGRQDSNREAQKRAISQQFHFMNNDTGKQRGIPKRPPTLARIDPPPPTPRVARPQRDNRQPPSCRRRMVTWSIVSVVCVVLAFILGYAVINFFAATNATADAAATATDFLSSLSNRNYDQAYMDLGPAITIPVTQDDFKQQAQDDDRCYGPVTNYSEVSNSAVQNNNQSYTYSFDITRSILPHPYTLSMNLQQVCTTGHCKIRNNVITHVLLSGIPPGTYKRLVL